ncbi:hypothetical protein PybrP1_006440 [[Pythium] brassicae (nom. inval.)]|nr:hypothetical protein PybrP1_006440 [[Pythium] brassicae (nom. inval.)]
MEQNAHLRGLVEAQQKLSQQVGSVLHRMQSKQDQKLLRSDVAVRQKPLSHADLVVFYDALTGKLDKLYAQLDSVFTDASLHSPHQQFMDAKVLIGEDLRATLQMRDVKVLPFNFETVHSVLWRHIQAESIQEGHPGAEEFLLPSSDEDVMLMRRALTVQLPSGDAAVEIPMRSVSKRFITKDRMVFCWEGTADWPHSFACRTGAQSVPLRENGWAVLKRVPGTDFSTIQMCLAMTPGLSDEHMLRITSREAMERALEKYVLPTYQELVTSRYQLVENMLFDESRSKQ